MKKHHRHSPVGKIDIVKILVVVFVLIFWIIVIMNEEYVSECLLSHPNAAMLPNKVCK